LGGPQSQFERFGEEKRTPSHVWNRTPDLIAFSKFLSDVISNLIINNNNNNNNNK
jgi:hypothetical protein